MIVVVSAIVDPWVTTLSFVVALAMRIQEHFFDENGVKDSAPDELKAEFKDVEFKRYPENGCL